MLSKLAILETPINPPRLYKCFTNVIPEFRWRTKQTLIRLGNLGAQAFPKHSQATYKKASPKPNSQAQNPKNNPNQKHNPKHKQKNRLSTQKTLQQQPNKEKKPIIQNESLLSILLIL